MWGHVFCSGKTISNITTTVPAQQLCFYLPSYLAAWWRACVRITKTRMGLLDFKSADEIYNFKISAWTNLYSFKHLIHTFWCLLVAIFNMIIGNYMVPFFIPLQHILAWLLFNQGNHYRWAQRQNYNNMKCCKFRGPAQVLLLFLAILHVGSWLLNPRYYLVFQCIFLDWNN